MVKAKPSKTPSWSMLARLPIRDLLHAGYDIGRTSNGYAYELRGKNWYAASSRRWETVVGDSEVGIYVGDALVDGSVVRVVLVGPNLYRAQLPSHVRVVRGRVKPTRRRRRQ